MKKDDDIWFGSDIAVSLAPYVYDVIKHSLNQAEPDIYSLRGKTFKIGRFVFIREDGAHKRTKYKFLPAVQEWMYTLPIQQQSVLVLGCRGPDGVRKHHPCKVLVRAYRAVVLKAALYGRAMEVGETGDTFMDMAIYDDATKWTAAVGGYFNSIDELPHHYHLHLMHGGQIIGYKHPDMRVRTPWHNFYLQCCEDMHVNPETEREMNKRLSDWGKDFWN